MAIGDFSSVGLVANNAFNILNIINIINGINIIWGTPECFKALQSVLECSRTPKRHKRSFLKCLNRSKKSSLKKLLKRLKDPP